MIKCSNCGRVRARGNFCPECGSDQIIMEPSTHQNVPSQEAFYRPTQLEQTNEPNFRPEQTNERYFQPEQTNEPNFRPEQTNNQYFRPEQTGYQNSQPEQTVYQNFRPEQTGYQNSRPAPAPTPSYGEAQPQDHRKPVISAKPSVSPALKKCKIVFFILILLEFIGVFLPLRSSNINIEEFKSVINSTSAASVSGVIVAAAFFLLLILAVLVYFSDHIGAAVGQVIQTLIIAFISILMAATAESEFRFTVGFSSNGIGFYVMLLVPLCMIAVSIVTLVQSIKKRRNP